MGSVSGSGSHDKKVSGSGAGSRVHQIGYGFLYTFQHHQIWIQFQISKVLHFDYLLLWAVIRDKAILYLNT